LIYNIIIITKPGVVMYKTNYILLISIIILFGSTVIMAQNVPTTLVEIVGSDEVELQYVSSFEKTTLGGWVQGASMPHPRYYGGSVMYTRNDTSWLYVLGGDTTGGGVATATCLKYNVITDTWEYIAPLPEPLRTNATAILGDKIYTLGGFNAPFPSPAVASFYEYDINTNIWTQLPDLPDPMFFAGAEGFEDSLIYIIGGMQDNVADGDLLRINVTAYFANSMQFSDATPMPEGTASFGHTFLDSERSLYITAGLTGVTGNFVPNNITLRGEIDISNRLQINWEYKTDRPLAVYAHYDYIESEDEIYSAGGSTTGGFDPSLAAYGYLISTNIYDTEPDLPNPLMAYYGGTNYMSLPIKPEIRRVAISGGITSGPALTNETWVLTEIIQDINSEAGDVPEEYSLMQNYPNPFNPSTTIQFSIPEEGFVSLNIFNSLGEKVSTLVSENINAGTYKYNWNASDLPSGIYFYSLTAENFKQTKKLILIK
jgi:hypothetical protein